jgi:hypothetical protein
MALGLSFSNWLPEEKLMMMMNTRLLWNGHGDTFKKATL